MNPLSLASSPAPLPELGRDAFSTRGTEHLHSPPQPPRLFPWDLLLSPPNPSVHGDHQATRSPMAGGPGWWVRLGEAQTTPHHPKSTASLQK